MMSVGNRSMSICHHAEAVLRYHALRYCAVHTIPASNTAASSLTSLSSTRTAAP